MGVTHWCPCAAQTVNGDELEQYASDREIEVVKCLRGATIENCVRVRAFFQGPGRCSRTDPRCCQSIRG